MSNISAFRNHTKLKEIKYIVANCGTNGKWCGYFECYDIEVAREQLKEVREIFPNNKAAIFKKIETTTIDMICENKSKGEEESKKANDLISKEKVIEILEKTGLITNNDFSKWIVDEINGIPTAYNLNKVVERLEREREVIATTKYCAKHRDNCDGKSCFECTSNYLIEIAKAGGESD